MIVPSIDIQNGRAVQLRRGREKVLDGGDPMDRLEELSVVGEVAVIDLDAALGVGSNGDLIREMVRRAPCRVGGGIRDLQAARDWLDAGAAKIILGTAAEPELCSRLPRERVIAAVDAERGAVVVEGWRTRTRYRPVERIGELAPTVGGFLLTQVEREGEMGGFDLELVRRAVAAAGEARLTAAGGITRADEIAALDALGVDAQVGMAIYSGHLGLGDALGASLTRPLDGELWPTVVCDELGVTLGLVWSNRESLARAVAERRGIYFSRSRGELWRKGATSGAEQRLLRVDLDCDRDALRFTVRQAEPGFCHTGERSCWSLPFGLADLERRIDRRRRRPEESSGTAKLLASPELLRAKLVEEAEELAVASGRDRATHELADLLYFALVAARREGSGLEAATAELARRGLRISRRPMRAREEA